MFQDTSTDPQWTRLRLATRRYWMLQAAVMGTVFTTLAAGVATTLPQPIPRWTIPVVGAAIVAIDLLLIPLRHGCYAYRITRHSVEILRGRFLRRRTSLATHHVLHTEVSQGPLLRMFGLAEVRFSLVVGGVELAPVPHDEAERIRTTLLHCAEPTVGQQQ